MMKTNFGFGDLALIFKVTGELDMSNSKPNKAYVQDIWWGDISFL